MKNEPSVRNNFVDVARMIVDAVERVARHADKPSAPRI